MLKKVVTIAVFLSLNQTAHAHIALDYLKQNLDSRYDKINSSKELSQAHKDNALSQLRVLKSKYTSATSLITIPSQQKAAEEIARQLEKDIQNFDNALSSYESESK